MLALVAQREDANLLQLLVLALLFFGPAIARLIKKASEGMAKGGERRGPAVPPSSRPASTAASPPSEGSAPPTRQLSWEELLRGELDDPFSEAEVLEAPTEPRAAPRGQSPLEGHADHDEEFLAPRGVLAPVPTEGELEVHGGDIGRQLLEDRQGGAAGLPSAQAQDVPLFEGFEDLGAMRRRAGIAPPPDVAAARPSRPRASVALAGLVGPAAWRRAVVLREVLSPPLALREREGPPGA